MMANDFMNVRVRECKGVEQLKIIQCIFTVLHKLVVRFYVNYFVVQLHIKIFAHYVPTMCQVTNIPFC